MVRVSPRIAHLQGIRSEFDEFRWRKRSSAIVAVYDTPPVPVRRADQKSVLAARALLILGNHIEPGRLAHPVTGPGAVRGTLTAQDRVARTRPNRANARADPRPLWWLRLA